MGVAAISWWSAAWRPRSIICGFKGYMLLQYIRLENSMCCGDTMNHELLAASWRDKTLAAGERAGPLLANPLALAAGERAGPPLANPLESQLTDDAIWLLLEIMPFKDMRSFLQNEFRLVRFYRDPNNYVHFLSIAKKRFESRPGLFSRFEQDNDNDNDDDGVRGPACLSLIYRAIKYETVLMHEHAADWESSLATTHSTPAKMFI